LRSGCTTAAEYPLNPKYLTVRKKALAEEFVLDKENLKSLLEKNIDKEGYRLFNSYTSRISFFSSMDDDRSSGISINIGRCNPRFSNTCVVHLPKGFSGFGERSKDFICLFKSLIEIFEPYYAFVPLEHNNPKTGYGFWKDDEPTYVHWMNYFDITTAEKIGLKKVLSIDGVEKTGEGYLIVLQDDPVDLDNTQFMQNRKKVAMLLGLGKYWC